MGRVITVANSKGGVGKTTLTLYLYQYLTGAGANCSVCDLDYQKSITRLKAAANLVELAEIPALPASHFTLIDSPPYKSPDTSEALLLSDFVLIPVKPSILDLQAASYIVSLCEAQQGLRWALVFNQVKPGSGWPDLIRQQAAGSGWPVLDTVIGDRVSYARALLLPGGLESEGNAQAQDEIADLAKEILTLMIHGKEEK